MRLRPLAIASAVMAMTLSAAAAPSATSGPLVASVAAGFLAPRYDALARAADANAVTWGAYCRAPDEAGLKAVQDSHRRLALAFGEVQAFRFGPIGDGSTVERLYFWPERKNATGKGLAALLSGPGPIDAKRVRAASAAAQGIPALERLAFAETAEEAPVIAGSSPAAKRACEAGTAIAAAVATLTAQVSAAWNAPGTGLAARLRTGDLDPALAPSMDQAASTLVTGFMTTLATIQDQKLEPVMGDAAADARPALSEARRSGLGRAMIIANLKGLEAFLAACEPAIGSLNRKSWQALVLRIQTDAEAMGGFPDDVGTPAGRQAAKTLLGRIRTVRAILQDDMPAVLNLKLGFNGLDGD